MLIHVTGMIKQKVAARKGTRGKRHVNKPVSAGSAVICETLVPRTVGSAGIGKDLLVLLPELTSCKIGKRMIFFILNLQFCQIFHTFDIIQI